MHAFHWTLTSGKVSRIWLIAFQFPWWCVLGDCVSYVAKPTTVLFRHLLHQLICCVVTQSYFATFICYIALIHSACAAGVGYHIANFVNFLKRKWATKSSLILTRRSSCFCNDAQSVEYLQITRGALEIVTRRSASSWHAMRCASAITYGNTASKFLPPFGMIFTQPGLRWTSSR